MYDVAIAATSKAYDAQRIFDKQVTKEKRQISLTDALENLYGSMCLLSDSPGSHEGKALNDYEGSAAQEKEACSHGMLHDALYDAKCAAKICQRLDIASGIYEYEKHRNKQLKRRPSKKFYRRKSSPAKPGRGGNDG